MTVGMMAVGSVDELLVVSLSPPPETETAFVTVAGAFAATSTVSVIGAKLEPAAAELFAIHLKVGGLKQAQPLPFIDVAVRPAGSVSMKVTVPLVAAAPELVTVTLYVAPVCP